jgi:2-haloacid dehalogenase
MEYPFEGVPENPILTRGDKMEKTIAFDIYGTLIDTSGVVATLSEFLGDEADAFSALWRQKQLEYSFRRGLMQNYRDFAACTKHALDYCCLAFGRDLSDEEKQRLMAAYQYLPPFSDVEAGLRELQAAGFRLFAFSNGTAAAVGELLENAGIKRYFRAVVSVDDVRSFKPNPAVYAHFLRATGSVGAESWLVSSNPFDVLGAVSAGMSGAWVRRSPDAVFDPWELEPTVTISSLSGLKQALLDLSGPLLDH